MLDLAAEMCVMYEGAAYRLLYHVGSAADPNLWCVRPIFVDSGVEQFVSIDPGRASKLHTQRA